MPGSKPGRKTINWYLTPERKFIKAILNQLWTKRELRGNMLCSEFRRLVPCCSELVGETVTDNILKLRAGHSVRYATENPALNDDRLWPYMVAAAEVSRQNKPLTEKKFRALLEQIEAHSNVLADAWKNRK